MYISDYRFQNRSSPVYQIDDFRMDYGPYIRLAVSEWIMARISDCWFLNGSWCLQPPIPILKMPCTWQSSDNRDAGFSRKPIVDLHADNTP